MSPLSTNRTSTWGSIKNKLSGGSQRLSRINSGMSSSTSHAPPPAYIAHEPSKRAELYSPPSASSQGNGAEGDDEFAFLKTFDTLFLIDDSGSMRGPRWNEVKLALKDIAPVCAAHDDDGIDIEFLNSTQNNRSGIRSATTVIELFQMTACQGLTPTGQRLHQILKSYLKVLAANMNRPPKPINIIVITDGEPSDDVESVIISAAKRLDALDAVPWQVGIQFFQVGGDAAARRHLEALDDNLSAMGGGCRDIVDTVPFVEGSGAAGTALGAAYILKVVLGAVNKRLDRAKV